MQLQMDMLWELYLPALSLFHDYRQWNIKQESLLVHKNLNFTEEDTSASYTSWNVYILKDTNNLCAILTTTSQYKNFVKLFHH